MEPIMPDLNQTYTKDCVGVVDEVRILPRAPMMLKQAGIVQQCWMPFSQRLVSQLKVVARSAWLRVEI